MSFPISDPVIPPVDSNAQKEEADLFKKRLQRQDQLEGLGHNITLLILKLVITMLCLIGVIRMTFLIIPFKWIWISEERIKYIDEFFIHGTIGALVLEFLRDKISIKKGHK